MAREGAADGLLDALLAAVRGQRRDLALELRELSASLDTRLTSTRSNAAAIRRAGLLQRINEFDPPPAG
jgi:hypothetical protein